MKVLKDYNLDANTIRLAGVVRESIVDGPGIRFVVFCQGCPHHCPGCHNPVTHDFDGGYSCEVTKIIDAIDANPLLDGVTFSGGEPACQPKGFLTLAKAIKERNLNIIMYSGFTLEELTVMSEKDEALAELLETIDYLIDGRYEAELRDLTLSFRGSQNQRIIDMNQTRNTGTLVSLENF